MVTLSAYGGGPWESAGPFLPVPSLVSMMEPAPGFASTEVFLGGPSFGPPNWLVVGAEREI